MNHYHLSSPNWPLLGAFALGVLVWSFAIYGVIRFIKG